jgi:hypothetical protein
MDELETRRYGYRKLTNQKINMEKKMDESGKKRMIIHVKTFVVCTKKNYVNENLS